MPALSLLKFSFLQSSLPNSKDYFYFYYLSSMIDLLQLLFPIWLKNIGQKCSTNYLQNPSFYILFHLFGSSFCSGIVWIITGVLLMMIFIMYANFSIFLFLFCFGDEVVKGEWGKQLRFLKFQYYKFGIWFCQESLFFCGYLYKNRPNPYKNWQNW